MTEETMQIKSLPETERPVEKACSGGIEVLSNAELLAMIIHTGTKNKSAIGLAEDVLSAFPERPERRTRVGAAPAL